MSDWMVCHPDLAQSRLADSREEARDIAAEWIQEDGVPHLEIWALREVYIPNPDDPASDKARHAD